MEPNLKNIMHLIESLGAEMHAGFSEMKLQFADLKARFDRQDARLERHGGLLQGGARSVVRMIEWSETADRLWAQRDERLRQIEERIKRLEEK